MALILERRAKRAAFPRELAEQLETLSGGKYAAAAKEWLSACDGVAGDAANINKQARKERTNWVNGCRRHRKFCPCRPASQRNLPSPKREGG